MYIQMDPYIDGQKDFHNHTSGSVSMRDNGEHSTQAQTKATAANGGS